MKNKSEKLGQILAIAIIVLLAVLTLVFFYLYMSVSGGYLYRHRLLFGAIVTAVIAIFTAVAIVFQLKDKSFVYRLCMLVMLTAVVVLVILYLLKISGFWERVDSIEDIREFISSTGGWAVFAFIFVQFLQVVILPVPGIVSIAAGVALFGTFKSCVYSFIGIMLGSLFAFFVGRILGYKAAKWLVGDSLDKALESVKGKDKIVLSFMFLFPFFPDDVLCFVAGISSMSPTYFLVMITITRIISIFFTCFSISGKLIPYNTPWGIAIWAAIFAATIAVAVVIYKNGEKIERFFAEKFKKNKKV